MSVRSLESVEGQLMNTCVCDTIMISIYYRSGPIEVLPQHVSVVLVSALNTGGLNFQFYVTTPEGVVSMTTTRAALMVSVILL